MKRYVIKIIGLTTLITFLASCGQSKEVINEVKTTVVQEIIISEEINDNSKENDLLNNDDVKEEYIQLSPEEVNIPILMYHSISDDNPENNLLVPPDMFDEQMKWLSENGYTSMNLDEALNSMETGLVPKKPVVITFDDGYSDNYKSAFQSLKKYNLKATFFVITNGVDDGYYMSSDMLKEMQSEGMSIENHTSNHLELDKLSREDAYNSIKDGQDFLRNVIGAKANYLCYPVGKYNSETIEIQEELGIKAGLTTQEGISSISDGLHELKRVRIYPMDIQTFSKVIVE